MIISASRRSDIPAFFGKEFLSSLKKGEFVTENPFNKKRKTVLFNLKDIDGIVFWTKNPENFFNELDKIKLLNIPFYFQFTINNYPQKIEPCIPSIEKRINILKELYEIIKPFPVIWRYDPIILTENFNEEFHKNNFNLIIEKISPFIRRITISILTIYRKIKKDFHSIISDKKREILLIENLNNIAISYGKKLDICCYEINKVPKAKCIDASLFFNKNIKTEKALGQRALCNCDKSIDIGFYKTCKHNCLYCYAK